MVRQARAQARTAVQLVRLHPNWRAYLATGINPVQRGLYALARRMQAADALPPSSARPRDRSDAGARRAARGARAGRRGVLRRSRSERCARERYCSPAPTGSAISSSRRRRSQRSAHRFRRRTLRWSPAHTTASSIERNGDMDELVVFPKATCARQPSARVCADYESRSHLRRARWTCASSARPALPCASGTRTSGDGSPA